MLIENVWLNNLLFACSSYTMDIQYKCNQFYLQDNLKYSASSRDSLNWPYYIYGRNLYLSCRYTNLIRGVVMSLVHFGIWHRFILYVCCTLFILYVQRSTSYRIAYSWNTFLVVCTYMQKFAFDDMCTSIVHVRKAQKNKYVPSCYCRLWIFSSYFSFYLIFF